MSPLPVGSPGRSANIFINYRREDSAGHAGRLFDGLSSHFPGRLFMDIDTIAPGVDFVEAIKKAVGSCEVLIVVIGNVWLTQKNAAGQRRLDDSGDFVRMEVEAALERDIRVIPVLVQNTPPPRAEDLPPSLAPLARRNAIELSDVRWAYDVNRLAQTIKGILREKASARREPPPPAPAEKTAGLRLFLLAALVLVSAVVLASAGWISRRDGVPPKRSTARNVASPAEPPASEPPTRNAPASPADVPIVTNPVGPQTVATQPSRPAPVSRRQEMPKPPASPPPSSPAPGPARAVPIEVSGTRQKSEPAAAEPAPRQETPAVTEVPTAGGELPAAELSRLGSELEAASESLRELYATFLGQKEDAGSELTASDGKLQEELESFADAAERFNKRFNGGVFARTRDRLLKTDQQAEMVRRFSDLAAVGSRVDRLMAEVRPSSEVRQEWQEVRRRWERVSQILSGR